MEEIISVMGAYKPALRRVMRVRLDKKTSTLVFGSGLFFKKALAILLWVVLGITLLCCITVPFVDVELDTKEFSVFDLLFFEIILFSLALFFAFLIRWLSYKKTIKLAEGEFIFEGYLRKKRSYTLNEYEGAETLRTVKGFPEEFVVKFKTDKGIVRHTLADLNMGRARNIEPNHEAVCALWDAIIQAMNNINDSIDVAPDTD